MIRLSMVGGAMSSPVEIVRALVRAKESKKQGGKVIKPWPAE